jgi:hypothetical protein
MLPSATVRALTIPAFVGSHLGSRMWNFAAGKPLILENTYPGKLLDGFFLL